MKTAVTPIVLFTLASTLAAFASSPVASRPAPNSTSSHGLRPDDRLEVKLRFEHPLDYRTLVPGRTFILSTEKHSNVRGSLHWSADRRSITFRSYKTLDELFTFDPHGHLNVRIIGTDAGQGAVVDARGTYLDGDGDDVPGGDYDVSMAISG